MEVLKHLANKVEVLKLLQVSKLVEAKSHHLKKSAQVAVVARTLLELAHLTLALTLASIQVKWEILGRKTLETLAQVPLVPAMKKMEVAPLILAKILTLEQAPAF